MLNKSTVLSARESVVSIDSRKDGFFRKHFRVAPKLPLASEANAKP